MRVRVCKLPAPYCTTGQLVGSCRGSGQEAVHAAGKKLAGSAAAAPGEQPPLSSRIPVPPMLPAAQRAPSRSPQARLQPASPRLGRTAAPPNRLPCPLAALSQRRSTASMPRRRGTAQPSAGAGEAHAEAAPFEVGPPPAGPLDAAAEAARAKPNLPPAPDTSKAGLEGSTGWLPGPLQPVAMFAVSRGGRRRSRRSGRGGRAFMAPRAVAAQGCSPAESVLQAEHVVP